VFLHHSGVIDMFAVLWRGEKNNVWNVLEQLKLFYYLKLSQIFIAIDLVQRT